jgi:hypothetical protein
MATTNLFKQSEMREALRARLERAYHWTREWIGEIDDFVLTLTVYALAGIWLLYSI